MTNVNSEKEEKYLVLTDEYQQFIVPDLPLGLKQGNIPSKHDGGPKLFIELRDNHHFVAICRIEGEGGLNYRFPLHPERIRGKFSNVVNLDTYDLDTNELTVGGPIIARMRATHETFPQLTIKDYRDDLEFEASLEHHDGENIFQRYVPNIVDKERYIVEYAGNRWEVDVYPGRRVEFQGKVYPLITADIENPVTGFDGLIKLPGLGPNVKNQQALRNAVLAETPRDRTIKLEL